MGGWVARLALLAASLGLVLAVVAWRLEVFRSGLVWYADVRMSDPDRYPELTAEQVVQLGWAHAKDRRPQSSYLEFPEAKPEGVTRIGVFGCSYAFGSEAPYGGDFPSWLAREFARQELPNVEVINFGVGAYGTHQAYLLHETLGTRYGLDVVIFNFFDFHRWRDDTFVTGHDHYGPLHARYTTRDGKLLRLSVLGGSPSEASAIYFGLVPAWRYLRYDAKPPPVLRALIPSGRELRHNPFRARPGDREIDRTYAAMVDRLAAAVPTLLVACNGPEGCAFRDLVTHPRALLLEMAAPTVAAEVPTLYLAPKGHLSAFANAWVAKELFSFLTGRNGARVRSFSLEPAPDAGGAPIGSEIVAGRLAIGDETVAVLVVADPTVARYHHEPANLANRGVTALLDLSADGETRLLPLLEPLIDGQRVELTFLSDGSRMRVALGRISAGRGPIARIRAGAGERLIDRTGMTSVAAGGAVSDVEVRVGGATLLRGRPERRADTGALRVRLEPVENPFLFARGHSERPIDAATLPVRGAIDLILTTSRSGEVREPLYEYELIGRRLQRFARPLSPDRRIRSDRAGPGGWSDS